MAELTRAPAKRREFPKTGYLTRTGQGHRQMSAIWKPAYGFRHETRWHSDGMGFPGINLAQVKTGLVAESQIATIARNGGRADSVIRGIGGQSREPHLRRMALSQKKSQLYPKKNPDHGCAPGDQPPDVKTPGRLGRFRYRCSPGYAVSVRH